MSGIITGRVFWTPLKDLTYTEKGGKVIHIKETTAKIVLLAIADSSNDFGEESWQSFQTIADKSSIERRSVIRAVRALINHGYLKVSEVTQYGTNKFTINLDALGNPPNKRPKAGRPKTSDSDAFTGDPDAPASDPDVKTGDPEAETSDVPSPDPLINPPQNPPINPPITPSGASLDWKILHEEEITQEELDDLKVMDEAPKMFEKAFGFGSLPWASNRTWQKFRKFVTDIYRQDRFAFGGYIVWRGDKGKYKAMSNKQIRMNPQVFMDTGWMEFVNSQGEPKSTRAGDDRSKYVNNEYAQFLAE